jgi:hypothetical protein
MDQIDPRLLQQYMAAKSLENIKKIIKLQVIKLQKKEIGFIKDYKRYHILELYILKQTIF